MFYNVLKTNQTDIYKITVTNELPKYANTELKSGEFLKLTNESDTLNYEILGYDEIILSLMYLPRGNILTYRKE